MVFAAPILILAYAVFVCLCFAIATVLPVMSVILGLLSLAVLVAVAVIYRRLKKKGWFSREDHDRLLAQEGGYWKVMGRKAARIGLTVAMILSGLCLVICAVLIGILYL